jgi:hypothetical protein
MMYRGVRINWVCIGLFILDVGIWLGLAVSIYGGYRFFTG